MGWIFVTAFHPEGTRLAIAGRRGRLTLWELPQTGTPVRLARIPRYRATAAFNADGSLLAAGHREGVGLWRPGEYAKPAAHLPGRFPVIALAFHPARQAVVGGGLDGSIALWSYDLTSPSFDTAQGTNTT